MARDNVINIIVQGKDKGATSMLGGIGKALGGLSLAGAGLVAGAGAGLGIAAKGLTDLAIAAMPLQGIEAAFDGITSSFEGGSQKMLEALQRGALGMVDNQELMRGFNEAAQLVSVDFAQTLPDAMQYLSKVSAATGNDMGFMIDSLIKGVGRMSPMILDNLGIQVNLTEALDAYAASLGKSTEELTKGEQQAALMAQVLTKLEENTASMPEVTGTAAQGWAAFKTNIENTKQEVGKALLPVFGKMLDALNEFAAEVLPLVVDWITTKLIPTLEDWWAYIDKNIIPILLDLADWLRDNLPPAIQKLTDFWNNTLYPALQKVWAFIQANVIPILRQVWDWIATNLPPAIKTLSDFWTNTLYPAIQKVWSFLTVDMMPIWRALADLLSSTVGVAITALTGLWQNVLQPALQSIWQWIQDKIIPIFTGWSNAMGGIKGIIDGIANTINYWVQKVRDLVNVMPDWLIPGSPTPFEVGLRGVADALRDINQLQDDFATNVITRQEIARAPVEALQGPSRVNNFYLTANYAYQNELSLMDDIKLLELMYNTRG